MSKDHFTVEIDVTILKVTDQAVLVDDGNDNEVWVPISLIENRDALDLSEGEEVGIELSQRIAEEKGFV